MFGTRRAIVLNKPAGLRDHNERQRRADQDDPDGKTVIKSYLREYIKSSQTTRLVLRNEEYEVVQTVTCTRTVIEHWKTLVAEADNTILRAIMRKDPGNHRL